MGCLSKNSDGQFQFEVFALVPAFLGVLSLVLLNTLLTRQIILESPVDSMQYTRPKRIMVFVCVVGALASVAMAVLLGLIRYIPMGSSTLASSITSSSICLLSRHTIYCLTARSNFIIFFGRPLGFGE